MSNIKSNGMPGSGLPEHNQPDPSMEDSELEEILNMEMQTLYSQVHHTGVRVQLTEQSKEKARELLKARDERREVEWRLDELKKLQALHTRTYRQTVTDNLGNVYVNESHGYISKYETQERIAELEQSLTKKKEAK